MGQELRDQTMPQFLLFLVVVHLLLKLLSLKQVVITLILTLQHFLWLEKVKVTAIIHHIGDFKRNHVQNGSYLLV